MMRFYMQDNLCTSYKLEFHRLHRFLISNGWIEATSTQEADILITGVCAGFEQDEIRSEAILQRFAEMGKPLYVVGCMVAVSPEKMPAARLFRSWEYAELAKALVPWPVKDWNRITLPTSFRHREDYRIYRQEKAFVRVSTGCGFSCSYCPHKVGVGEIQSQTMGAIVGQVRLHGGDIIVLTGVDTASYGRDIGSSFAALLPRVLICGNRVHIAQYNPEGLCDEYGVMVEDCSDPLVTDLQLPIQTTSPRLLELMNRHYAASDVAAFINDIRPNNPCLRTDVMVGFPTESDKEFEDTIEFVGAHFQEVAMYRYEHKVCTPIARSGLPLCSADTIDRRMEWGGKRLREAGISVHSGGQDIESLMIADKIREGRRAES